MYGICTAILAEGDGRLPIRLRLQEVSCSVPPSLRLGLAPNQGWPERGLAIGPQRVVSCAHRRGEQTEDIRPRAGKV